MRNVRIVRFLRFLTFLNANFHTSGKIGRGFLNLSKITPQGGVLLLTFVVIPNSKSNLR